ncbi:hypothetical protein K469DRAFT_609093 [Zopfia rhizophila CBS 207.26]|uniref:Uncharacterized protein n=1 Tax=Zopfia rhizophila CBS 207.26 TaxID=1314779 RepID=A0A6A6D8P2_9PEZI|nr:hypothetical protein K469DRAFT_609093 [Zopfia rhizophila CBS 207.26]
MTVYDKLITLKKQLAPTEAYRMRELIQQYRKLQQKPKNQNNDRWLDSWVQTVKQCRKANLPDVREARSQMDFLTVVREIDAIWATPELAALIWPDNEGRLWGRTPP